MSRIAVSICIATFNGEPFLGSQLDSIIAELGDSDELIIIDDGSIDATRKILIEYANKDYRFRLFFNKYNIGVIKTFEKALNLARNDIVFLADQDDVWLSGKIDNALKILQNKNVSAVLTNAEIFIDNNKIGRLFFEYKYKPKFTITAQFYKNNFIGCCMCFRRSILSTALPFPDNISMHDWWLGVNALVHGTVVFDPAPAILYRRHSANVTSSSRRNILKVIRSRFFNSIAIGKLFFRTLYMR